MRGLDVPSYKWQGGGVCHHSYSEGLHIVPQDTGLPPTDYPPDLRNRE